MRYEYFFKQRFDSIEEIQSKEMFDVFISVFNKSERVIKVFEEINSEKKIWLVLPEYGFKENEYPTTGEIYIAQENEDEGEIIRNFFSNYSIDFDKKLCFDITGFLRPHLAFLIRYLKELNANTIYFIYTDAVRYKEKEKTSFSGMNIGVDQIHGYKGPHIPDTSMDVLIIGAGYDQNRIREVASYKLKTKKILLLGFPAIQADMFQENLIKTYEAENETEFSQSFYLDSNYCLFAPANDPFTTAQVISDYVKEQKVKNKITNLYLSPLSTKAQTLGMCLYYIFECNESDPVSIIFPYCEKYERETSEGVSKIWLYTFEYPDS